MAPSVTCHKGLLNGPGQNNCFLNSAVQVLWHLDIFRRSFRDLSGHACMADSCIFCALKDLFGQLQFSHERALPPDALRKALAQSFSDEHRFQLGFMDDAAECFENILLRIHFHIAHNEEEDMCNSKHCIPHQKFAMTLVEQSVCGVCHATSEPLPFTQMVHYVSASALISQASEVFGSPHPDLFGQLLKKAGGMGDIRDCPSSCGAKIQIRRTLINRPEIVSVGIVWDSDRPSLEHIMSLLDTLRTHLRLSDVFHGSFNGHSATNTYHQLVGVVTYYGKHYSTFFFHTKLRVWVYFDDAHVKEIGPHWENVVEKCRRGRYQPLLLLFATPNGTPIDASSAPKSIKLVDRPTMNMRNGHDVVRKTPIRNSSGSPDGLAMGGGRSLTPNPEKTTANNDSNQRRAVTPNPEPNVNTKPALCNNDYQNLAHFQELIFNRSNPSEEQTNVYQQDSLDKYKHPIRKDLVRRDSGNWSGDRNSASSSSSTSLENPYHFILGKMHMRNYNGVPRSPNKNGDMSSGSGSSSGGPADPGYDSFSISSTDSYPVHQNMKSNFQLAQIPEGLQTYPNAPYAEENARVADDCERLCAEVDQLLDRSERAEDLITALSLCNAAVNKARAAMNAPYSNPQTASFATMKHNACVLRARSLHRKLEEPFHNNLKYGEARHSREGSNSSARGSTTHLRQNSKDKGNHLHSRQNSQDLLDVNSSISSMKLPPESNGKLSPSKNIEIYATLPKNKKGFSLRSSSKTKNIIEDEEYLMKERPSRSTTSSRSKTGSKKEVEKRARSEDRSSKNVKEITSIVKEKEKDKEKEKEQKKQSKQEEKQNKKQHKIRRKLLMGGLMRRKNRSMPDLREDEHSGKVSPTKPVIKETSKDDSMVGAKSTTSHSNLNGYLSEGNLEYAGNPNLEKSKLMRKSFHGSKILQFNKVPPPPPLRTTSQLSRNDCPRDSDNVETVVYANHSSWLQAPTSLPYLPINHEEKPKTDAVTYSNGGFLLAQASQNTVVTEALVHHDPSFQSLPPVVERSDNTNKVDEINFQLPPYPSPIHSNAHSRQASEEFPPPPPALPPLEAESSLISKLQEQCENLTIEETRNTSGDSWLRELQAKQANCRKVEESQNIPEERSYVQDLKLKFEQNGVDEVDCAPKRNIDEVRPPKPSNIRSSLCESDSSFEGKRRNGKKKNVTFCEQVVLVATADEDESDGFIPNPILERVLRKLNKESNTDSREHAIHSVVPLKRTDSWRLSQGLPLENEVKQQEVLSKQINQKTMEDCDAVDGFCPPPVPQIQNYPTPYISPNSYSPNYIPASSLCSQNEYSENISITDQKTEAEYYNNHGGRINSNGINLKMNDSYHDMVRYSPVCRSSSPMQNGYHSTPANHTSSSVSNCYQPASLQYYPPPNRSSPQISYRESNEAKTAIQTSLVRQNSNASHQNRQLPPQDPRRLPIPQTNVSMVGPKMTEGQRHIYTTQKSYAGHCSPSYSYANEPTRPVYGAHHLNDSSTSYHEHSESPRTVPYQSPNTQNQPYNNIGYHQPPAKVNPNLHHNGYQNYNGNLRLSPSYGVHQNGPNLPVDNSSNQYANSPVNSYQYSNNYHQNASPVQNGNYHQQGNPNTNAHLPHYHPLNQQNSGASSLVGESGSQQPHHRSIPHNTSCDSHFRNQTYNGSVYQHIPHSMPNSNNVNQNYQPASKFIGPHREGFPPAYQHPPQTNFKSPVGQRVPTPVQQLRPDQNLSTQKYQPYQNPPVPKQIDNDRKLNASVPCNLCRKKQISPPSVYCTDCDFYISRFKPKT